jgi:Bacterial extracellular solute-binding protein
VQRILVGRPGQPGTAAIPKDAIIDLVSARGTPDLLDSIKVMHISGGASWFEVISTRAGELPRRDAGLPMVRRRAAGRYRRSNPHERQSGTGVVTFTPLLGMSETVRRFLLEPSPDRSVTTMTIDDVGHFTAEEKAKIIASYPAHEREARTKGIPTLGSDVSNTEAFKHAMLEAESLVYNTASSGIYVEKMLERLGMGEQLKDRTKRYPTGSAVMEHLIRGTGKEVGIGPITEIKLYSGKGLQFVGPLPPEIQNYTSYDAAPVAAPANRDGAIAFLKFLGASTTKALFVAKGIE